jgi:hypothetical protein
MELNFANENYEEIFQPQNHKHAISKNTDREYAESVVSDLDEILKDLQKGENNVDEQPCKEVVSPLSSDSAN